MRQYFGTDGIRGKSNVFPLTPEFCLDLGKALGTIIGKNTRVAIAKDTRISCDMFASSICAGLTSTGVSVEVIGTLPTPALSHIVSTFDNFDIGIMISASHNYYLDNGIKIFSSSGYKLPDEIEANIERLLKEQKFHVEYENFGNILYNSRYVLNYIEHLKKSAGNLCLSGIKIALDCANGSMSKIAPKLFEDLGATVFSSHDKPNGFNINEKCGATMPEVVAELVKEHNADIGISFDGDGDRLIIADDKSKIVDGDIIIGVCAKHLKDKGLLNPPSIVGTVMSNLGFEKSLEKEGIGFYRSSVGDRYVMDLMQSKGIKLGGEQSGHIIFLEYAKTGDGLLSAIQILKVLSEQQQKLSEARKFITVYPQILKNLTVKEKIPLEKLPNTMSCLDAWQSELKGNGRLLLRYSGTENKIRIMIEGQSLSQIQHIAENISETYLTELSSWDK